MAGESPFVRLTVDQLGSLVDRLSVRNRTLDDKSRWTKSPSLGVAVGTNTANRILPINYYRRAAIIGNTSGVQLVVGPDGNTVLSTGFNMPVNGTSINLNYEDLGAAICGEWWAVAAAAGGNVGIVEIVAPSQIR